MLGIEFYVESGELGCSSRYQAGIVISIQQGSDESRIESTEFL